VNLHDWIDELMDALDIETEVDEALVLDLARDAAHQVERKAAPITTFLLGFAAGQQDADEVQTEALAAKASALAAQWDRPADAADPDDVTDEVPDDRGVDHSGDKFEDD
jgi:phosphopantothenoylcysteine synthetase/decarboxylase